MMKLLNKLTLGNCCHCGKTTLVRPKTFEETTEMSHSCVTCVPIDNDDMNYHNSIRPGQGSVLLH